MTRIGEWFRRIALSPQPRAPGGGARGGDERPPRDDGRAGTIRQHAAAAGTRARCVGMELARRPGARSAVRGARPAAHARLHDRRHPVAGARLRADRHRRLGRQRLPAAHAAIPRGRSAVPRPLRAAGPLGAARHDRPGLGLGAGRRRIPDCLGWRVVLSGRRRLCDGVAGIAGVEGVHRRPGGLGRRRAAAVGSRFRRRGRAGRPHRSRALAGSVCRESGRDRPVAAHRVRVPSGNRGELPHRRRPRAGLLLRPRLPHGGRSHGGALVPDPDLHGPAARGDSASRRRTAAHGRGAESRHVADSRRLERRTAGVGTRAVAWHAEAGVVRRHGRVRTGARHRLRQRRRAHAAAVDAAAAGSGRAPGARLGLAACRTDAARGNLAHLWCGARARRGAHRVPARHARAARRNTAWPSGPGGVGHHARHDGARDGRSRQPARGRGACPWRR